MDAVFVLGNKNSPDGTLSPITQERVKTAVEYSRKTQAKFLITTGGKGRFFNASPVDHCVHVQNFAAQLGFDKTKIKPLILSKNTVDEVLCIKSLVKTHGWKSIAIVSSSSHIPRIRLLCTFAQIEAKIHFIPTSESITLKEAFREMLKTPPSIAFILRRRKESVAEILNLSHA